jgi:hypothetical protein
VVSGSGDVACDAGEALVSALCVGGSGSALQTTENGASCGGGSVRIACMAQ